MKPNRLKFRDWWNKRKLRKLCEKINKEQERHILDEIKLELSGGRVLAYLGTSDNEARKHLPMKLETMESQRKTAERAYLGRKKLMDSERKMSELRNWRRNLGFEYVFKNLNPIKII